MAFKLLFYKAVYNSSFPSTSGKTKQHFIKNLNLAIQQRTQLLGMGIPASLPLKTKTLAVLQHIHRRAGRSKTTWMLAGSDFRKSQYYTKGEGFLQVGRVLILQSQLYQDLLQIPGQPGLEGDPSLINKNSEVPPPPIPQVGPSFYKDPL